MTRPLRVAQLVTTMSLGGAQLTVIETSTGQPDDISVELLTGPDLLGEGDLWEEANARDLQVTVVPQLHRSIRPVSDLRALIWLVRWLRRERPDVLHTHSTKAGVLGRVAARLAGVPVVHTVHGWSLLAGSSGLANRAIVLLERSLASWTRVLVTVTRADIDAGLERGIGRRESYALVRSAIDLDAGSVGRTRRDELRRDMGVPADGLLVGTVARLAAVKRVPDLVRAFSASGIAGEWRLVVIGDGPDRAEIQRLAAGLPEAASIHLVGSRPDAAQSVAVLDLFVLCSAWEGLPRALIEAMAAGVPVIATDVGGVREVVEDGVTGLVVAPRNIDQLSATIRRMADDPQLRESLVGAARSRVDEFSLVAMRSAVAEIWCRASDRIDH